MDELAFHYDGFKFHSRFIKYEYKENMKLKLKKPFNLLSLYSKSFRGHLELGKGSPSRFKEVTKSKEKRE